MDKKIIAIEALAALAADTGKKSEIARVREIINYIETTLASGVSRERVLETLRETLGLKMNLKTFEKNLYRIRKKQKTTKLAVAEKTNQQINAGSQQLITSQDTKAETTSVAVQTQQSALAIIHEDDDDDEGVQTVHQPHDLKKVWKTPINMVELTRIGKERNKQQSEDEKNESYRN